MTYLYDDRDLMTYMQDGNMADQPKWLHTQYDNYGRPTQTGFVTTQPTDGNSLQTFTEELTRTFYDGQGLNLGTIPDIYKGKVSRSESRILGESDWLYTNNYYDSYGRILQNISNHHLDPQAATADETNFEYDYADNLVRSTRIHRLSGATTTIEEEMHYDHAGRLFAMPLALNSAWPKTPKFFLILKKSVFFGFLFLVIQASWR